MANLIHYFNSRPRITALVTAFILLAGTLAFFSLKRESLPPVDFGIIIIQTSYPGASPDEVEDLVTLKIEDELRGIDGIKDVRSVSRPSLSEITVRMSLDERSTDQTADDIQRAVLRATDLPADLPRPPRVVRIKSGQIPIFDVAVVGGASSEVRDLAAEMVQDQIEDVEGVAEARLSGYRPREFTVFLDAEKLHQWHVSLKEVTSGLSRHLRDIPGGYLKQNGTEILVRTLGKMTDAASIESFIIRGQVGSGAVRIKDVARVLDTRAEPQTLARVNAQPAALLSVIKQDRADTIKVVEEVQKALGKLSTRLPEGIGTIPVDNEATRVRDRLHVVIQNAWSGLALILVVLLFLLPGTIGLMASLSLPISFFALVAVMVAFGLSFNSITMIAMVIVLGLLIDNSAVIAESYSRFRFTGEPPEAAAGKAAKLFFIPILATVLTNIAGFAPLLVTTGVMGQFVFSIPVVISVALILSLVETFFLLPSRLRFTLLKAPQRVISEDQMETGWFGSLQRKFVGFVRISVQRRYAVFAGITLVMLSAVFVSIKLNDFDLFPKERTELYTARFEAASGTALEETDRIASSLSKGIEAVLKKAEIPFDSLVSQVGTSQTEPDDPQGKVGNHTGLIRIHIPMATAETLSTNKVQDLIRTITHPQLPRLVFEAAVGGPPVGPPLNVTFRSQNETALLKYVSSFKKEMGLIGAVKNLADDIDRGPDELQLELNNDFLRRAGFTTEEVGVAIQTALQGVVVSNRNIRSRKVEVRVRLQDRDRADRQAIEKIQLLTPNDTLLPLGHLAGIRRMEGPVTRKRFDFQRAVVVSADVDPRQMSALDLNAKARSILARLKVDYSEVETQLGGEEQNTQESLRSLFFAMALSLLVIFVILVALNNSYGLAFLILSTIPLGLSGVSYVFWLAGRPLSFMALIGVIGLGGVIVNAAIVLVSFLEIARRDQPDRSLVEIISQVTALRFKAVLVTNITTIVGLVPTAYGFGGKDPLLVPLSLAMGWGLLVGSFLSLVWLPCGYMILNDLRLDNIRRLKTKLFKMK